MTLSSVPRGGSWTVQIIERIGRLQACHVASLLLFALIAVYVAVSNARPLESHVSAPRGEVDADVEASRAFDADVNLVRLSFEEELTVDPRQDHRRGWMVDPIKAAEKAGLQGGALACVEVHLGQVYPGKVRGNHRHHHCNETFILWGAKQRFRLENPNSPKGYSEVVLGPADVAVAAGRAGLAHAIASEDTRAVAYLLACQDGAYDVSNPRTDYNVWPDL